jgi:hypothetical protein
MRIASARASTRVDGENDVGRLGRRGCPARGQCHPCAGRRERGSVVDPVPDHDRRTVRRLAFDRSELAGRVAVGQHGVHAYHAPHHVCDVRTVPGDQDDTRDAGPAQRAHHPGCVRPDRVLKQEGTSGLAVDGGEDRQ